jgi:L-asparaginase II
VIASSHSGQPEHVAAVLGILNKIGMSEDDLKCGTHPPFHKPTSDELIRCGLPLRPVHCNCSGKHCGLLSLAAFLGADKDEYWLVNHPAQQAVLGEIEAFCGISRDKIVIGVDGCGVPVFGMPLYNMALSYSRLVTGNGMDERRISAGKRISSAMMDYPFMVAGSDRICTELMEAIPGGLVAKSGAEGVYCLAITGLSFGAAIKIEDGNNRAMGPIIASLLRRLEAFPKEVMQEFERKFSNIAIKNFRGEVVGEMVGTF